MKQHSSLCYVNIVDLLVNFGFEKETGNLFWTGLVLSKIDFHFFFAIRNYEVKQQRNT